MCFVHWVSEIRTKFETHGSVSHAVCVVYVTQSVLKVFTDFKQVFTKALVVNVEAWTSALISRIFRTAELCVSTPWRTHACRVRRISYYVIAMAAMKTELCSHAALTKIALTCARMRNELTRIANARMLASIHTLLGTVQRVRPVRAFSRREVPTTKP